MYGFVGMSWGPHSHCEKRNRPFARLSFSSSYACPHQEYLPAPLHVMSLVYSSDYQHDGCDTNADATNEPKISREFVATWVNVRCTPNQIFTSALPVPNHRYSIEAEPHPDQYLEDILPQ